MNNIWNPSINVWLERYSLNTCIAPYYNWEFQCLDWDLNIECILGNTIIIPCWHHTVSWAQIKQVDKSRSRDYQNMMGDTILDHYHHIWKSYQIGSYMKIFKKQIFILYLIFSYKNSATYEKLSVKKFKSVHRWCYFHFISHIFIWK